MKNNIFESTYDLKVVIINHGITASGKSTVTKKLVSYIKTLEKSASVHSTDNYFLTDDGSYHFDVDKLGENHAKNQKAFFKDLEKGINFVMCDNTNLIPWQAEPYTDYARNLGYKIIFIDYMPRDISEHECAQKITDDHLDAHNIPLSTIERMAKEYWQYRDLLYADIPIDTEKHANFIWDLEKKERVKMSEPSKHFDLDYLVVVEPRPLEKLTEDVFNKIKKIIKGIR